MLEELAWTEDLPVLTRLVLRQDSPRSKHYLPRPLTADQDQLTQQELLQRNDRDSNALLLLRQTGMRICECAYYPLNVSAESVRTPGRLHLVTMVTKSQSMRGYSTFLDRFFRSTLLPYGRW